MKIENKNENIEMNINVKKDKFDNWDIVNYVQDYINKYKSEIDEYEKIFGKNNNKALTSEEIGLRGNFLRVLENIFKYARANEEKALKEIYQVDEKTGMISKAHDIDDKALDEIFNYCERNIEILESINSNSSDYSSGVYSTCRYIKEIIDIAESKKVE
jgi:hypothetical protein